VAPEFRNQIIRQYLAFMLKLGWQPSEIYFGPTGSNVQGLEVWRDLFLRKLQKDGCILGDSPERAAVKEGLDSMDKGKSYVFDGCAWLEEQLFGSH
jgi:hypothetical protein